MPYMRRVPRHAVDRPLLRGRLDAGVVAPLTLVVAPAGSGKTVLLAQWAASRSDLAVAWLEVAFADADPSAFAGRLVAAVARADPRVAAIHAPVGTPTGGLGDPFIEAFAAEISALGELVVVFDDLHHIGSSEIVTDLWRLVDRLPPNAHFVFASRVDLRLGWSRHRLAHGLVELRQAQLAFDDDMTGQVLQQITGMTVSDSTAALVTRHTEGWAAGVQLSALSMRFHDDSDRFADHLGETDRLIIDYLTEEVFDGQTPRRRKALLRLSVLDEVCAGLAESVAGISDGDRFLQQLERESMFIVAVPDRPGWYRFHHLFRDLLMYRLRATDAEGEGVLLRAAADWYLAREDTATAVEYLLRARAWESVARIVLAAGVDVYERSRATTVARWLSLVPEDVRRSDSRLELVYGMTVGISGRGAQSVEIFGRLLGDAGLDLGSRMVALTYLSSCAYFQPHPDRFREAAQEALTLIADHPEVEPPGLLGLTSRPFLETVSRTMIARADLLLGDFAGARIAADEALQSEGSRHYGPYRVQLAGTLALVEAWAGRLERAAALAEGALDLARDLDLLPHPAPADAHLARAIVAIQRGEAEAGAHSLHEGSIRAAANQRTQLMWIAHLASALIDPCGTDAAAIEPHGAPPPAVQKALMALEWRRSRLEGAPRDPGRWLESVWSTLAFEQMAALLERGSVAAARSLFDAIEYSPDPQLPAATVEHQLALAWLTHAEGHADESRAALAEALELAESEGLVYPVTAAGPTVSALIHALPGPRSRFRQRIARPTVSRAEAMRHLPTALTSRELELLEYLPTRLSNGEIAEKWFVSVNTVKTHMAHLYRKLDAKDRRAAIVKAQELGLLREDSVNPTL